ncbi:hypothetical protein QYE76_037510, partial [Lolium multiflorum]
MPTTPPYAAPRGYTYRGYFGLSRVFCHCRVNFIFQAFLVFATIVSANQWTSVSGMYCQDLSASVNRPHSVSITEFGAVGDGITLNTKAFQNAIFYLTSFANKGGAQLFVPTGRWLTGSFSLISHLTVSLDKDAVIIGSP